MHLRTRTRPWLAALSALAAIVLLSPVASAEDRLVFGWPSKKPCCEPAPMLVPAAPTPVTPALPEKKDPEKKEEVPAPAPAPAPVAQPPIAALTDADMGPAVGAGGFSLASSNVGYIDPAIPRTGIRLRYDSAYDNLHPNRAEYFYAKYKTIGGPGVVFPETKVDYQDIRAAFEYAFNRNASVWIEAPVRFLNPEVNENSAGFSDMNFGFKYAFVAEDNKYRTFQFRTYAPTGAEGHGLGVGHWSLEPGFLFYQRMGKLRVEGEVQDWIPIGGTNYAGNVLRYGIGLSYDVWQRGNRRVAPVVEFVGWSVLGGLDADFHIGIGDPTTVAGGAGVVIVPGAVGPVGTFDNPANTTIINAKVGVRVDLSDRVNIYAGYGKSLTGQEWYKELIRFELRYAF